MTQTAKPDTGQGKGRSRSKAWVRWLPAVLWMAVIFYMSSRTGSELGTMFPFAEHLPDWMGGLNSGHLVAYYVLGLLVWWGLGSTSRSAKWLSVLICTAYGVTDEFHQLFVDGRSAELRDLVNDFIGACLAMLTVSLPPVRRRLEPWLIKKTMG